jgi:orotidine-5'-phosphate decarboxylase
MSFKEKLHRCQRKNDSLLCVGLDIDATKLPSFLFQNSETPFIDFNQAVIEQTKDLVCAYKMNLAFYEALGSQGYVILEKTIAMIPKNVVIILDGKRNDIGNTAGKYAEAYYNIFHADAVTINPYLGWDGIEPFVRYKDKCCFILCKTSNVSAGDFQNISCSRKPLYVHVAEKIQKWHETGQCGVVVGATCPTELKKIRNILSEDIPFLIPGIGRQGGDLETSVRFGTNSDGELAIINSSRGILYAGTNEGFAGSVRAAAESLHHDINSFR